MDLVADDGSAGIDQRFEAIDDLAVADADRGQVDDIAVLRLDRRRLEIEDDELRARVGERRGQLGDGVCLGAEERNLLRLAGHGDQLLLQVDALLELALAIFDGIGHDRLGQDLGTRLDHHHRIAGAGHDQVEAALRKLAVRWVGDELAVDASHADRADRTLERDVADAERRRGAVERQHVRIVLLVRREDGQDHLHVIPIALREERADRPVGEAHGQDGRLRRARLALDEAARDLARGVHALLVVHGEREEVDPLPGLFAGHRGGQYDGVAIADEHRSVGLLGELARFEREAVCADFGLNLDRH